MLRARVRIPHRQLHTVKNKANFSVLNQILCKDFGTKSNISIIESFIFNLLELIYKAKKILLKFKSLREIVKSEIS